VSISFITGKPGAGKGVMSMKQIVDELVNGKRHIICNTPIRIVPWIFGNGSPQMGLKAYLQKTYDGKDFDCDKRVHILTDEQAEEFYLWRYNGTEMQRAACDVKVSKEGEERIMQFDTHLASQTGSVLYVLDEAWKFFGSRNWQKTGEGMLFYSAQHRHFGDDVLIVTQHTKQIDPAIQRVAQDFWVVKNHSKLSIGLFRQPDLFSVAIYDQAPTGSTQTPMTRKVFRIDTKGICQTYDTSAGVGLSGRFAADVGGRKKGFAWYWLALGCVIVIAILCYIPHLMGLAASKALKMGQPKFSLPHVPANVVQGVTSHTPASEHYQTAKSPEYQRYEAMAERSKDRTGTERSLIRPQGDYVGDTNTVFCTGYTILFGDVRCYFSDGSTAFSDSGEVVQITPHFVTCWGRKFRVILGHATTSQASTATMHYDYGQVSEDPPVNQVDVLPSIHSQGGLPPPSLGGISQMSNAQVRTIPNSGANQAY
jgi:hypothetical protein